MTAEAAVHSGRRAVEEARRTIRVLFQPGDVVEIRALNVDRGPNRPGITYSGYFEFDATDEIVEAVASLDGRADGIYVVLNRVNPALLARARNRLQVSPKHTTSDSDIIQWCWLYIDVDPVRPAGISASDVERQAAHERALKIREFLSDRGWPEPVYADSGNGAHLLYCLPLLDLGYARRLVEQCLKALDKQFSDELAKVDTATANASRICKLYGTKARKGDSTPERPHRIAQILGEPERLTAVPVEALEALASDAPAGSRIIERSRRNAGFVQHAGEYSFDLDSWIKSHGLDVEGPKPWKEGRLWTFPICPFNPEHRNKSAYIAQFANGIVTAGCHHNGCDGKDWHLLRDLIEPGWRTSSADGGTSNPLLMGEWEPPIPFDRLNLPPFPTEVFPLWLRTFVEAEAVATQTPPDLTAMLVLSALAAACGKKLRIQAKEGYQEPLNIFTVTALPPGNRKSAVFSKVVKPIEDYEREEARRTGGEIASSQALRKIKESKLKRIQEQAAKAKGLELESLEREIASLAAELAATPQRVATRCIADDCTPEKLSALLQGQGGRIAVLSPEGDVFDLMAGRYSTNGSSNLGVYLKGHAGDTLRIDRVGRTPEFVKDPALTVGLAVQPDVIRGLAGKPGFRGRGLLARFLYSLPTSQLGYRDTKPPAVPEDVYEIYRGALLVLLNLPNEREQDGEMIPHLLTIDTTGQERLQRFESWVEPQLSEFGDLGRIADWGGKVFGAVIRIAGLLHMAEHAGSERPWDVPVAETTIEVAIQVGMYLIPHAKAAFAEMGADQTLENAKLILRWIRHKQVASFSRRDVHQAMRGTFRRASDLEPPLALLTEHGFIRKRPDNPNLAPGRPSGPIYDVNPQWER